MPASGPRPRGAIVHPRPCQGCKPWPRSSAAFGLVLATQKLDGITGRGTRGGGRDLNPRPPGPQPGALPTELPPPRTAQNSRFGATRPGAGRGPPSGQDPIDELRTRGERDRDESATSARPERGRESPDLGSRWSAVLPTFDMRGLNANPSPRSGRPTRPGRVPPRARLRRRRGRPEHDRGLAALVGPAQPRAHGARSPPE